MEKLPPEIELKDIPRDRSLSQLLEARGELKNLTGIDSPYEPPEHAEVRVDTVESAPEDAAESIIARLRRMGVLG